MGSTGPMKSSEVHKGNANGNGNALRRVNGTIRFLSLNDIYSVSPSEQGLGGYPQIASLLKKVRKENKALNPEASLSPENTLLAVLGDVLGGGALQQGLKGEWVRQVLEYIHTDLACVGNHEFDYGSDVLIETVQQSAFKWFGGNIRDKRTGKVLEGVLDTAVLTHSIGEGDNKEVIRIGLFGVCTAATPKLSFPGPDVEFLPAVEHAAKAVKKLREEDKVDVVVGLTHLNLSEDKALAKQVNGIDLILGGHDHDPYAVLVNGTLILKCGMDCEYLGVADLSVSLSISTRGGNGEKTEKRDVSVSLSWAFISNKHQEADEGCAMIIQAAKAKLSEKDGVQQDEVLLDSLPIELDTRASVVRERESVFANILADAMREEIKADIALINSGFIRGNKIYGRGTSFTAGDVMMELPFRKTLVVISMTGENFLLLLEQHLSALPSPTASFPNVSSNVRVCFAPEREAMRRVQEVIVDGVPIERERTYKLVVTSFLASGGDNITAYLSGEREEFPQGPLEAIIRYLRGFKDRGEKFSYPSLGRMVALP